MVDNLPRWLYDLLYYLAPLVIAAGVLVIFLLAFSAAWRYIEAHQPPPRPRIEVLAGDGVRCVVVDGTVADCQWQEDTE